MAKRTQIREGIHTLLSLAGFLPATRIYLGGFDPQRSEDLPVIRIYPSDGEQSRHSMDRSGSGYLDTYTVRIEAIAKETSSKSVEQELEELLEDIVEVIRDNDTINSQVNDAQAVDAGFDYESHGENYGSVRVDVVCEFFSG